MWQSGIVASSRSINQAEWWVKSVGLKVRGMQTSFWEVASLLSCGPDSVVEVLKGKFLSFESIEALADQRDRTRNGFWRTGMRSSGYRRSLPGSRRS
jgi:hypothetical protein